MSRIYIGFEPKAAAAYWIQKASIKKYWRGDPNDYGTAPRIAPIVQQHLRMIGAYDRPSDPLASTEFTYTRFLVPWLAGYRGWALFMDGDMMARANLHELFELADPDYAVMCVKHEHRPSTVRKMGGLVQSQYPRKNWSSLVLYNCEHPKNQHLTPELVSKAGAAYLHQFKWLDDREIGALPETWNWLVGESPTIGASVPADAKVAHFTLGMPGIHPGCDDCAYADEWFELARSLAPDASFLNSAA